MFCYGDLAQAADKQAPSRTAHPAKDRDGV